MYNTNTKFNDRLSSIYSLTFTNDEKICGFISFGARWDECEEWDVFLRAKYRELADVTIENAVFLSMVFYDSAVGANDQARLFHSALQSLYCNVNEIEYVIYRHGGKIFHPLTSPILR
ncbi:hypothetical protein O9G_000274 [Rozella allomycis CSF55]|uniref:Uncharacterized protein n=1 Tax=Rozella allomycis (strain CSF55) TaxID=988480 RepID=A0A075ASU4_ROZAC|nr:hypothetical protein O9G_000274 [Rozella allomycis CSF55]|eukprot:EPZ31795.1 hypothetical protein O9G_000274 [Rozella allomycis CSF55]